MRYESSVEIASESIPGVRFTVERMSFGRRLDLIRRLKGLTGRLAFLSAAPAADPERQAEAALLAGEINRLYLSWGLRKLTGLQIDGEEPSLEALLERGPEGLVQEILNAIRHEAGLSEAESKNSKSPFISSEQTKPDGSATVAGT
jgi:hypothetical protein